MAPAQITEPQTSTMGSDGAVAPRGALKAGTDTGSSKLKFCRAAPHQRSPILLQTVEAVADFIFLGSKITTDGDYSHEIKRHLLLGRKAMTNLDRVLKKQRHHFADKCPYSQSYNFSNSHVWI